MSPLEISLVVVLLLAKSAMVLCEVAFTEARRSRLERRANQGTLSAQRLLRVVDEPGPVVTPIQLLNSAVAVVIGISCSRALLADASMTAWAERGLVAVFLLILSLFIGDLVPRMLARAHPEVIGEVVCTFGCALASVARPLLYPVFKLAEILLAPFGGLSNDTHEVSEEDIKSMVLEGKRSGVVEEGERVIIHRVFRLGDKNAASVMTPRNQVVVLEGKVPFQQSIETAIESHRSWFPVTGESTDEVLGIVSARHLLDLQRRGVSGTTVEAVVTHLTPAVQAPETTPLLALIESMRKERNHFAVVVDEYGTFAGIATLHDVVEALIGEVGEIDDDTSDLVRRSDGSLLVDARMAIDELWEELAIDDPYPYGDSEFHSLGGFIMTHLGHVPREGEEFEAHGYTFEVVDMDRQRIDKVIVRRFVEAKTGT
jgi:putative hemolysin